MIKVTVERDFETHSTEFSNMDVSLDQLMDTLYSMLVGLGFSEVCILENFKDFSTEKLENLESQTRYILEDKLPPTKVKWL